MSVIPSTRTRSDLYNDDMKLFAFAVMVAVFGIWAWNIVSFTYPSDSPWIDMKYVYVVEMK